VAAGIIRGRNGSTRSDHLRSTRPCSFLAYAVLTVGVGFKLVPLLLIPVFVLDAAFQRSNNFWRAVIRESAIALLVLSTWPLLTYVFGGGDRSFVYLEYHAERAPDITSVYAGPLFLGWNVDVTYAYTCLTIRGEMADTVGRLSPYVVLVALGLAILVFTRAVRRNVAQNRLSLLASGCVLVWLAFILTNKVGSPQYLLWIAPLVPLLPRQSTSDRRWPIGFVLAGSVGTAMYPFLFPSLVGDPTEDFVWPGPNTLGLVLLFARWSIIGVLTVWLAVRLWKTGSQHNLNGL
jgi:hypothetical protein